ncbi:MAG TPA: hypothetical protein VFQ36_18720 [Ktedonobacteraceae bacterium]|nr:hypothetical protein [Ktedonobacteraceae bacterium]
MKNPAIFVLGIVVAIIGIALGAFFLVPNINHIITDTQPHIKHAIAFFALAVVGILIALVNRPKASTTK